MTKIETKNEAEYLAMSHGIKREMFDMMCSAILANYNKIAGTHYRIGDNHETPLLRLFAKLEHIAFNLYSPQSIPDFLKRIVTKPVKVISKPGYTSWDNKEEVYGIGHFRWDWKSYTLNENELKVISIYLGLHIKEPVKKLINTTDFRPKPDFNAITDYNEQAKAFLQWTKTDFITEFKEHAVYFDDDKEARDIYYVTLENNLHKYKFTFGQSINNTGNTPTPYDVLACLQKYEVYDFKDFCDNYGYDTDSRKARKIYKAVKRESENVRLLFTPEQIELLQEIQ